MSTALLGAFTVNRLRRRSLLRGAASVMDLRGNTTRQYTWRHSGGRADFNAIDTDWRQVGDDLRRAVDEVSARIAN